MSIVGKCATTGASMGKAMRLVVGSLLEFVYPQTCVLCDAHQGEQPWCTPGALLAGLQWYDGPHLCWPCSQRLQPAVVNGALPDSGVAVYAGRPTGPQLVSVLGQWKYHGVRGLAWPLAQLVGAAVATANAARPVDYLVPIPLHRRRQRVRSFNQAAVLAHLAAADAHLAAADAHLAWPAVPAVRTDVLRRVRATGQQAKLKNDMAREVNLAGAFAAVRAPAGSLRPTVGLVDDLVTGGATCDAATRALQAAGWDVRWVAALGLAAATDGQVDTDAVEI